MNRIVSHVYTVRGIFTYHLVAHHPRSSQQMQSLFTFHEYIHCQNIYTFLHQSFPQIMRCISSVHHAGSIFTSSIRALIPAKLLSPQHRHHHIFLDIALTYNLIQPFSYLSLPLPFLLHPCMYRNATTLSVFSFHRQ